jgi:hypothetical protein
MSKIILKTWFETGLGDFYTCLFATKVCFDFLKSKGFEVEVFLTSNRFYYGEDETIKLLKECFNLEYFDIFHIKKEIPKEFIFYKNIENCFDIYISNKEDRFFLEKNTFYQYSCEKIFHGNPYPEDSDRLKIHLLSEDFKNEIKNQALSLGNFETIFIRYVDSTQSLDLLELTKISDDIKQIADVNKKYFISCWVKDVSNLRIDGIDLNSLSYKLTKKYDIIYHDFLNMCLLHFSEKINYRWYNWSNYVTFSLLHNNSLKNFENYFIRF